MKLNLKLNKETKKLLEKIAKEKNLTTSQVINLLLEKSFKGMIENERR